MKLPQFDRLQLDQAAVKPSGREGGGFSGLFDRLAAEVQSTALQAQASSEAAALGGADLTQISTSIARAELMLETLVSIRDKLVGVYNDLVRTPL